jgi:molecular chaperone DnaK
MRSTSASDKVTSEDKTDLKEKIEKLRQTMGTDDYDAIKEAHKNLQEASWKVSQRAYQSSGDGGDAGAQSGEQSSEGDQQKESKFSEAKN